MDAMDAKELVDEIAPKHDRTSCSDADLSNADPNSQGYSRCVRCCLLYRLRNGEWPMPFSNARRTSVAPGVPLVGSIQVVSQPEGGAS